MTAIVKGTRGKELNGVGNKGNYLLPGEKPKLLRYVQLIKHPDGEEVSTKTVLVSEPLDCDDELDRALIKREKHSIAKKGARAAHRDGIFHEILRMSIRIPILDREDLLNAAICAYNNRGVNLASLNSNEAFLERIQVNYLRHRCANYDRTLSRIADRPGANKARTLLRKRIHEKISATYPHLALECRRQDGLGKTKLARISEQMDTCSQIS